LLLGLSFREPQLLNPNKTLHILSNIQGHKPYKNQRTFKVKAVKLVPTCSYQR
jgi:hypothetical protein